MENAFGNALRERRREVGMSQRELADRTKLDFSYISKMENGRLPPPAADTIVQICRVLEIPSDQLLALTGKLPSNVQQTITNKESAQAFLREAQEFGLSDDEWKKMIRSLRGLMGRKR